MLPTTILAVICIAGSTGLSTQILPAQSPLVSFYHQTQTITSVQDFTSVFNLSPTHVEEKPQVTDDEIIETAKNQIGVRYVWGGTSRRGFDCSGFVQYVFDKNDIELPRTSIEQWRVGESVRRSELKAGDLVFFRTRGSRVSHVGIYKGDNKFIHASSAGGRIRINELTGYYASRYAGGRRILEDEAQ